jgi:hypothetical protein
MSDEYEFEYCPADELWRDDHGVIRASDSGSTGWQPWRTDACGTAWYRRPVSGGMGRRTIYGVPDGYTVGDAVVRGGDDDDFVFIPDEPEGCEIEGGDFYDDEDDDCEAFDDDDE